MQIVCPKCGRFGWLVEMRKKSNTYYLVSHYDPVLGRTKCYLGPREYKAATKTHEDLMPILGIGVTGREFMYLDYITSYILERLKKCRDRQWCQHAREELARTVKYVLLTATEDKELLKLVKEAVRESMGPLGGLKLTFG